MPPPATEIRVHHGRLTNLAPDTDYVYAAVHDGASPEVGTVRTAPRGRAPLHVHQLRRSVHPDALTQLSPARSVNDNLRFARGG